MSNDPQKFNGGEYADKARDMAKEHPDQARSAIDKVQQAVNSKTGGKFGSLIEKAGDFVEDKLGLPEEKAAEPKAEPKGEQPSEPKAEPKTPAPEPGQDGGAASAPDSTGEGKLPG